jgi:beta-lactam-binding protein with PASTA domain
LDAAGILWQTDQRNSSLRGFIIFTETIYSVFEFITKRSLGMNILAALLLGLLLIFIFFQTLDWLTEHGNYVKVPDIKGKKVDEAQKLLEAQGFEVEVQDSVFFDTVPALTVMKQLPMPGEMVKVNRTIYLTVNRVQPPLVVVPNFMGQTFRSVEMQLKTLGFKLGDTSFRPDFAVGSILEQLYNGVPVRPGTSIPMGSRIDLVLGSGLLQEEIPVPALLGMTFSEAKLLLEQNGLLLGAVVVDGVVGDSSNAFVIKQHPPMKSEEGSVMVIRGGQIMDLWISMDKEKMDTAQLRMMPPKTEVISQE